MVIEIRFDLSAKYVCLVCASIKVMYPCSETPVGLLRIGISLKSFYEKFS